MSVATRAVSIFPADAGVNPVISLTKFAQHHIPRGCGGEPAWDGSKYVLESIFPADAGVNLVGGFVKKICRDIPRGCGGEPGINSLRCTPSKYSPRMRG